MATILVADDEPAICEALGSVLAAEGHRTIVAANGLDAVALVERERPALAFLDVRMPGLDGLEALRRITAIDPELPVVVMTAYGTLETATAAIRSRAFDYLGKPLELAQIRAVLRRALHRGEPGPAAAVAPEATGERPRLVGQSAAMQAIFKQIALLADNELGVLVLGESGVGKELVARAIHASGRRAGRPFVAVNCAAIPAQLVESELFGHERGAFTDARQARVGRFEAAGDGTLFLDEISELPLHQQGKLLRVLQERVIERVGSTTPVPFRARVICASNRDLARAVADGAFREDLYRRIDLVTLRVPPLRERLEDLPALAQALLVGANRETGMRVEALERAALERLAAHDWPGNVRELEHVIKRSVLGARGATLSVHELELGGSAPTELAGPLERLLQSLDGIGRRLVEQALPADGGLEPGLHELAIARLEAALIGVALETTGGNQVAAARLLGMNRSTLRARLRTPDTVQDAPEIGAD
jgi:DNA-binding NtrC family response regulator